MRDLTHNRLENNKNNQFETVLYLSIDILIQECVYACNFKNRIFSIRRLRVFLLKQSQSCKLILLDRFRALRLVWKRELHL